jgi:long-chain acyl-CoA synthetase
LDDYKGKSHAELAQTPAVTQAVQSAVNRVNKQLADFERIRRFRILPREFSVESGELTPTMKIRRSRVLENERALITELYPGKESDI